MTGHDDVRRRPYEGAPVAIVGGGPVGLALAGDLGWRGIPVVLLEQSDGSIHQPKMDGVNVRTMEFCRRWGIADDVRNCPYPREYPQDMVYLTSLTGYELGREAFMTPSGGAEERQLGASPETRVRCPQTMFDPILRRFAERFGTVDLRYRHRFAGFAERPDGVTVEVEDLETGQRVRIEAAYLVGCDGAGSAVRDSIGIAMQGSPALTYTTNVIFRCPDLVARHDKQLGYRHIFIGPEGTWGTLVAINGRDEWRLSIIGSSERRKLSDEEVKAAIRRSLGADFPFEIVSVVPWVRRELIAERYAAGRVFLAGDSAHVMSPTGGFGMNTGIGDAVDLSWKIDATLRGWGGPGLLASYDAERRPVAARAAREASGNLARTLSPGPNPGLLEPGYAGALLRYEVGRKFAATLLREWYKLGIDLGYTYAGSPVCWPEDEPVALSAASRASSAHGRLADGTPVTPSLLREWHKLLVHKAEGYELDLGWEELPPDAVMIYRPTARPGARAPHVWLADGRSTLDLFGPHFTLLRTSVDAPNASELLAAAARVGMPLTVADATEPAVADAYGAPLVLVRPDGHVAWRGRALPIEGAEAILDRVRGAG